MNFRLTHRRSSTRWMVQGEHLVSTVLVDVWNERWNKARNWVPEEPRNRGNTGGG